MRNLIRVLSTSTNVSAQLHVPYKSLIENEIVYFVNNLSMAYAPLKPRQTSMP